MFMNASDMVALVLDSDIICLLQPRRSPAEPTESRTRAVCFPEAGLRRSLQCFALLSGDPVIYLKSLWNTD